MNTIIPTRINFEELVKTNSLLSDDCQSKLINILNQEFSETEKEWYVYNLFMYLNYDSTEDYPINLEDVYKMIGFANKGNAMKTIKNNFIKDEDYRVFFHMEKNLTSKDLGGRPSENVMLNADTFKNLCMIAKTDKGKEIRKYYVKLENIYNKIIKEEIEEQKNLLEQQKHLTKSEVEKTLKTSYNKRKVLYLIKIYENDNLYKFGYTDDIVTRLRTHKNMIGDHIELIYCIESENNKLLENQFKEYLYKNNYRTKKTINDISQTELFTVNDINIIKSELVKINNTIQDDKALVIKLKNEILDLKSELLKKDDQKVQELKNEIIELKNERVDLKQKILDLKLLMQSENTSVIQPESTRVVKNIDTIEDRIYKKRKVDKIDPSTLTVIETYECINAILANHPDKNYSYNQIYRCIVTNRIYDNFRWNYTGSEIKPTHSTSNRNVTKIVRIAELNASREFVQMYPTKTAVITKLGIHLSKLNQIIHKQLLFENHYYILEDHLEDEKISITAEKYQIFNCKQIRETNIETNEVIIYNSMKELSDKRGVCRATIRNCIKENRECNSYKWEYAHPQYNKNNCKRVKETNIETNEIIIYESMKQVNIKRNLHESSLKYHIRKNLTLNGYKYEFI
jgi:phage anti-repressor protein